MIKSSKVLCEVIFKDPKLGISTSQIGTIDKSLLNNFFSNSNKFVIFNEKYKFPILKSHIEQIMIYQAEEKVSMNIKDSKVVKHIKTKTLEKIR